MNDYELSKRVNFLILLGSKQIELYEELEAEGFPKFKLKKLIKSTIRELEREINMICKVGKEQDVKAYKEALDEMPKFLKRLDVSLEKIYGNEK